MNIFKKSIAAILAFTAVFSVVNVTPTNSTVYAETTSIAAAKSNVTDIVLSRNMIAFESEAKAAGVTTYGTYVNPNDIESASAVNVMITSVEQPIGINTDLFLAKDTENCDVLDAVLFKDIRNADICVEICNYNNTKHNLYYNVDTSTGLMYQTFNTNYVPVNNMIPTDTSALANDPGDKVCSSASANGDIYKIFGFAWLLDDSHKLDMPYDDACGNLSNNSQIISVVNTGTVDNNFSIVNVYELFGIKWINTHRMIKATEDGVNFESKSYDAFTSDKGNEYQNIVNNSWIRTNGRKGDTIKITATYDMYNNVMLARPEDTADATLYSMDKSNNYHTMTYTLAEDNERLPLRFGNYVIYNEDTGIYETSTSCLYCSDKEVFDNRLVECTRRMFTNRGSSEMTKAEQNFYGMLGFSNLDDFTVDGINEKIKPIYDIPKTLNISDVETIPLINIVGENVTADQTVSANTEMYFFDGENRNLNVMIGNAAKKYCEKTTEFTSVIPYTEVKVYDFPANKSELTTYFTTSNIYSNANFNTNHDMYVSYTGKNGSAESVDSYVKNIKATMSKHTVYGKDIKNSFPDYNGIKGDMNQDGVINVADVVMCQKYMLGCYNDSDEVTIANYAACNLLPDDRFDVFDLVMLKRMLLKG